MHLSFWEIDTWFTDVDYTIVGSGIVGLQTALHLQKRFPDSKILVIEKGMLPQGASTKNAGFACFGSISEIVADLEYHSEEEVVSLIEKRWNGLSMLRETLGDEAIDFRNYGGYELFFDGDRNFERCADSIERVNSMLMPIFGRDVFQVVDDGFGFSGTKRQLIYNPLEGQIDTGRAMKALLKKAVSKDIMILNQQKVSRFSDSGNSVEVTLNDITFKTKKLLFATNGFASELLGDDVRPARAQVLITKPIHGLRIKGTFHVEEGFYYFRNIGDRVLFGGARNLDVESETTTDFGQSEVIQNRLETLLKEVILPGTPFEIEHRWSGIMGMGDKKSPIVRQLSENVYCGVRLGGMGVAIGSLVGKELAELV